MTTMFGRAARYGAEAAANPASKRHGAGVFVRGSGCVRSYRQDAAKPRTNKCEMSGQDTTCRIVPAENGAIS